MGLEIKVLDFGEAELDSSFFVAARSPGTIVRVPILGYLILGSETPVLVDTGFYSPEILTKHLGTPGIQTEDQHLENQLSRWNLETRDIQLILHTHLHIDHAGQDSRFPMDTKVVVNRRELEFSVAGLMGEHYAPEDVKHLVDRLHTPGALRLLDLEMSGPEEIIPGVRCEAANGHTEGSMNILVETDEGTACICGDVIFDVQDQVVEPHLQMLEMEPASPTQHATSKRMEKAAVKKVLNSSAFILPSHDYPAKVEQSRVVGHLREGVPGTAAPVREAAR